MNWDYISGFFDADGSIMLTKNGGNEMPTIQLSFHNNDVKLITQIRDFILNETGVSGNISKKPPRKSNHNMAFDLKYSLRKALIVIAKIKSSQRAKKHKIDTCLKFYVAVTPRNGRYSERALAKKYAFYRLFYWSMPLS